jgi:hypothetical protein
LAGTSGNACTTTVALSGVQDRLSPASKVELEADRALVADISARSAGDTVQAQAAGRDARLDAPDR